MEGLRFSETRAPTPFSVLISLVLAGTAFGARATGSVPRATVPPSTYQNGLVNAPNPIGQSGNLAITGNVGGGRHFRGNVPYTSTSSFGAPLGSTNLDSFLRYSAVPEGQTAYPQNYTPFYSPTQTVTTTSPGYRGVFTAASPRIAGSLTGSGADPMADTMSAAEMPRPSTPADGRFTGVSSVVGQSARLPYLPMPMSPEDAKMGLEDAGSLSVARVDDPLTTPEEYQRRLQLLLQDLDRVRADAAQIEQKLDTDGTTSLQQPAREPPGRLPLADVVQDSARPARDEPREAVQGVGLDGTGLRLYDPSARPEGNLLMPQAQAAEIRPSVMESRTGAAAMPPSLAATLQRVSEYVNRLQAGSGVERAVQDVAAPDPSPVQAASPQQAPADEVPQTYENASSITQRQFDQYMATAATNMRLGRFDRAADSFTLASVYIPHDPRAHLGKSHALLAVGDYVNSAASLARAVELDAQLALKKVNLVETIGGPDSFVERISKLEELAQGGDASLQFVLAYVYHQMDRLNEAKTAVEASRTGSVSSIAVGRLAAVIGR